ncbi:MAG TPA: amidohydrolase family protein [Vicinamibacterales bacterium]|nr:amidohydrolase family protein [Vicinamibacterales bacterium]
MSAHLIVLAFAIGFVASGLTPGTAQQPDRPIAMGTTKGVRYQRLVIQNAMIVSGRGEPNTNRAMPPEGPVDIVIEGDAITNIVPLDPVNSRNRGARARVTGDRVIDASGMYVIPGLIEMHAHLPGKSSALGPRGLEYAYRLYLGHGVTTVRDAGTGAGLDLMVEQRRASDANGIVAPRLVLCQRWPLPVGSWDEGNTPDKARAMVQRFKDLGADCVKVSKSPGQYPDVLDAIVHSGVTERGTASPGGRNLKVMVDLKVSETSALVASNLGVTSIEHFYGVPESALESSQSFPADYNYWDELDRFRWAGRLWTEADRQHPERILELIDTFISNGTNWDPTMAAYEKNRDFSRAMTLPYFQTLVPAGVSWSPDASVHGHYHREWKTSDEVAWRQFFAIWMKYVNEFYRRGGLLTAGSDQGDVGGIGLIRELELLQEAGLNPIDIVKVATTNAASVLGFDRHCGVRVGCVADLAVVNGNPIDNLKVLYGRGYGFYGIVPRDNQAETGGVKWTIKGGVVFDAQALLREVEGYVQETKRKPGTTSHAGR